MNVCMLHGAYKGEIDGECVVHMRRMRARFGGEKLKKRDERPVGRLRCR
jgi:hypothetical protein